MHIIIIIIITIIIIIESALSTYAKFDDVMREKYVVLFLVKHVCLLLNYTMNIYVFVNILVILHLLRD